MFSGFGAQVQQRSSTNIVRLHRMAPSRILAQLESSARIPRFAQQRAQLARTVDRVEILAFDWFSA